MNKINETHSAALRSFVKTANAEETDFPIQNLPFGVFRRKSSSERFRCGVAIGDQVLDLTELLAAGCVDVESAPHFDLLKTNSLNPFMAAGSLAWSQVRLTLSRLLRSDSSRAEKVTKCLVPMGQVEYDLPARIGDYSDFFVSQQHAKNVLSLFNPGAPMFPQFKWLPIAYHGRASSIEISGATLSRPMGQGRVPGQDDPGFGPVRWLDYEVEIGFFVGPGNRRGNPISLESAESHIFGACLLNDWSSREVQGWESMPLGPFLSKSFLTTISPWVVTLEALEPFRCAQTRSPEDHRSFDYLEPAAEQAKRIGIDIQLEAWLRRPGEKGDGTRLSKSSSRHAYWAPAQLLVHHTENGCNLQTGDLIGSGTQSGPLDGEQGCMMELTMAGKRPIQFSDGDSRAFLADGDTVLLKGSCQGDGFVRIGFGDCAGTVSPAASVAKVPAIAS